MVTHILETKVEKEEDTKEVVSKEKAYKRIKDLKQGRKYIIKSSNMTVVNIKAKVDIIKDIREIIKIRMILLAPIHGLQIKLNI